MGVFAGGGRGPDTLPTENAVSFRKGQLGEFRHPHYRHKGSTRDPEMTLGYGMSRVRSRGGGPLVG